MKTIIKYLLLTAAFGAATANAGDGTDCDDIADAVREQIRNGGSKEQIKKDDAQILEIVRKAVSENQECAADIVAAAIQASNASNTLVGQIVQTAGNAAPGQINNIVSAATGAAPLAAAQINAAAQTVQQGGTAGGGGAPNPLDAPGATPAGQATGVNDGGSSQGSAGNSSGGQGNPGVNPNPEVTNATPVVTNPGPPTAPNSNN